MFRCDNRSKSSHGRFRFMRNGTFGIRRFRMQVTTATTATIRSLLHSTVLRRQRGEDQEEQRVGGCVQSEIEKAVDQNGEAASQRAGGHTATKLVVRLAAREALAKKNHDEGQAERAADYSAIG